MTERMIVNRVRKLKELEEQQKVLSDIKKPLPVLQTLTGAA